MRETDLFPPLKDWLERNGYTVHAEVGHCDIAAGKNGELVLIEMKRSITLDLLLQAVRRQRAKAGVYVAVPAPKTGGRAWRERLRLLRRLEIGLLVVYLDSALPRVELIHHPVAQHRRVYASATRSILSEIAGRSKNLNTGGRNSGKLHTAYREAALGVLTALEALGGEASPKAVRAAGASEKSGQILFSNHYGWFENVAKGLYRLSPDGRRALVEYADLVSALREAQRRFREAEV